MKRTLNEDEMIKFVERAGSLKKAASTIAEHLECSISKAEKLASGRYPSCPTPAEQKALAKMLKLSRDLLFPAVSAAGYRAS